MRKILILLAGASLFLTAACGDDDPVASADSYDDFESEFMAQCTPAAAGAPSPEDVCRCAFGEMRDNVPLDEVQAWNEELQDNPAATPPDGVMNAITTCATESVTSTP